MRRPPPLTSAPEGPLELLFEDEGMAIVNKPSGIAVHKGMDRASDNVLSRLHRQLDRWVWPSHRLDRATSGALVFALNETAASVLARAFQDGLADKTYLAWARGAPDPREGEIDYAVPKSEDGEERVDALTRYRTVAIANDVRTSAPRYGLVVCHPQTGRYHQIRRHLRHVHCPILGDTTYGDGKENKALRAHGGLSRLALHALSLSIPHWRDPDRRVHVVAPIPEDLRAPMRAYGVSDETLDAIEREARQPSA